jgi:hypothetical protein
LTCCPTLILAGGGPWLSVLGGVITDKVIVQRLTDMVWMGLSSTEEDARVYHVTRVFIALRQSLKNLKVYYSNIQNANIPKLSPYLAHPRFFPYPTTFSRDNQTFQFRYIDALEKDTACVTYLAVILNADRQITDDKVVIKFVARYGEDVHRFLAVEGHAPTLWYYGPLPGASPLERSDCPAMQAFPGLAPHSEQMHMVVMDYVVTCSTTPPDARQQVENVLTKLHCEGYVFGDLRLPNILFDTTGAIKFIDFNWCGRYDERISDKSLSKDLQQRIDKKKSHFPPAQSYAHYPMALSMTIQWPEGVSALKPIRPIHDWHMFDELDFN